MDGLPFRKIDGVSGLGLRGQPLRACYLGRLFRVDRLRNAYFGRPSQSWYIDAGFHPSLEDAKESVQEMRAKGSQWLITERPAVVLCFDRFGISVCSPVNWGSLASLSWKNSVGLSGLLRPLERRMFFFKHGPEAVECLAAWPFQYKSWVCAGDLEWTRAPQGERRNAMAPIIAPIYFELLKAAWSLAKPRGI